MNDIDTGLIPLKLKLKIKLKLNKLNFKP